MRTPGGDRKTVVLGLLAFFLVTTLLTGIIYVLAAGLLDRTAPRTSVERELSQRASVLAADPENAGAYASYVEVLVATQQYASAAGVLAAGEVIAPDDPALLLARARLHRALGETEEALDSIEAAVAAVGAERAELDESLLERGIGGEFELPGSAVLVRAAALEAEIRAERGETQGAIDALTRGINESPTMTDLLVARGDAYLALGRTDEARSDYEAALVFVPDLEEALLGIAGLGGESQ